ncbi:chorismate mutase [Parahaliea mediterranea]|uniref:chorismate mutase n=1 Tax=Parahaliea mediterranea TaxID=651086 RepID=UPI0019D45B00|nr:chorismate mutase [Parahaliea mediterranea]
MDDFSATKTLIQLLRMTQQFDGFLVAGGRQLPVDAMKRSQLLLVYSGKAKRSWSVESLDDMRKSIDNIDNAIVAMLAERFKVTNRVGYFKANNNLPVKDPEREAIQHSRIKELSNQYGLDPELASSILGQVIDEVVLKHQEIARSR